MQKLIIALIGAICFQFPLSASALSGSLITTVAGTTPGFSGDGGVATAAQLNLPIDVAVDAAGNLFIADQDNHIIRKVDGNTGLITTVAGTGTSGFTGDGGPATAAQLVFPKCITVDPAGNLFFAETSGNSIRKVDSTTGIISTVAGIGTSGFTGDGGVATAAQLFAPSSVAVDVAGNLFIADEGNNRIRKVDNMTGIISTVAGSGGFGFSGDGGAATAAQLNNPTDIAVDAVGNLFIADLNNRRIRKVDSMTGIISTVAGLGTQGSSGDGGAATAAQLNLAESVAVDAVGNLFIADRFNSSIRKVDSTTGIISTVAGTTRGFSGDSGAATAAQLNAPSSVVVDVAGNLFIADRSNNRIRKVEVPKPGDIHTVAGTGTFGFSSDDVAATAATLSFPDGIAIDAAGNLFIVDQSNHRIRKVNGVTGVIMTVAGTGNPGFSGDGAAATAAQFNTPIGIAVDVDGNLFIPDFNNHRIRKVDGVTGVITTVAGTGTSGFSGDEITATVAQLNSPAGVAVDAFGNLFIADQSNRRIRKVDAVTGVITTVAGTGTFGFSGDGAAATTADLASPRGIAVDANGNLFIADLSASRIRKVDGITGVITTVAGTGTVGFSGDGGGSDSR